jgi:photosystem II stability/assembly factor-like uncharacterized protein
MKHAALFACFAVAAAAQSWQPQTSGTTASLRGVSALNATVAWASGTKGTYLRTADGGATWHAATVKGAADMDFRAIHAIDDNTAVMISSGEGPLSRVYRTADGGASWMLVYTNPDAMGFFDSVGFWDEAHGILLGDPVKGRFTVMTTADGGVNWHREKGPAAGAKEGAFAASGGCLFLRGTREAWFSTGGPGGARVFHTMDGGETWSVAKTPVRSDSPNAGIFSLAFSSGLHGIAVGGDYKNEKDSAGNIAITEDGGKSWSAPAGPGTSSNAPGGYRSAVAYVTPHKMWIATGPSGSDVSLDGGKSWKAFDAAAYHAMSFTADGVGWAVGPNGAVAKFGE